jgi:RNA polymerase sigma-70 factor (ECF subfamily)
MQTTTEVYPYVLALPKKYRTAVHLHYYEGYRVSEIAKIMGSTENTVKSHLFRARDMLREQLKGEFQDV